MAGVLNFSRSPIFRPFPTQSQPKTRVSIRSSAESSSSKEEPELGFSDSSPTFSPPPNFKPPQSNHFSVRPDKLVDILAASPAPLIRLGTGSFVCGYSASLVPKSEFPPDKYALEIAGFKLMETSKLLGPRPEKPLEIYEFESCPFCRKVREIVAVLDLDVLFYPCPRNGPNFRQKVAQIGGKQLFPYMMDPNTGVAMYESDDIIKYLVGKYGDGNIPFMLSLGQLTTLTEGFAMIGRMGKGNVPYLEDPNTGVQMFKSAEIIDYLRATYAL
ncbi:unnamed protein product [Camellia sinensis]